MNAPTMRRFTGTKSLRAVPMTRGEYNAYRGWVPPEGEEQSVDGYLVEYEDGGAPNDSRHAGYISWSPADVFVRSYRPSETPLDRLRIEKDELEDRLKKLRAFLAKDSASELGQSTLYRLTKQESLMSALLANLSDRIEHDFAPGN